MQVEEKPPVKAPLSFEEFISESARLAILARDAEQEFNRRRDALNAFLHEHLGTAPGEPASVESVVAMVSKIIDMKARVQK